MLDFQGLYDEHSAPVHRFLQHLSGDRSVADDLTSETFVRLWLAPDKEGIQSVRAYVMAIARNLYLMHLRGTPRGAAGGDALLGTLPDAGADPERQAVDRDRLRSVQDRLAGLPEIDRAALCLRAFEGLSYEEIAAALDISVAAARVKVHRARLRLGRAGKE
ncbi:MAG: sigma-70 family RNA polymerase sigma factor [Acidobacteriota bacterium]